MASPIFIAVNQTISDIVLDDLRVTIPGSGQVNLTDNNELWRIQSDSQLLDSVNNDLVLINDGTTTLTKAESLQYLYPVASKSDLQDVQSEADKTVWANVAAALGGEAASNAYYVFKSDGYGDGYMVKNTQVIPKRLTVGTSGDVDYTSIKTAIDYAYANGATALNPWEIIVRPGTYTENPMTLYPGINVLAGSGQRITTVTIAAANPNEHLFTCYGGVLAGFSIKGVTDSAKYLIYCNTAYSLVVLHSLSLYNCSNGVFAGNGSNVIMLNSSMIIDGPSQGLTTGITADGYGTYLGISGLFVSCPSALLPYYATNPIQTVCKVTNQAEAYIVTITARCAPKDNTADVFFIDQESKLTLLSGEIANSGNAVHIGSSGSNTSVTCNGIVFTNNLLNIFNESSTGSVFINASIDNDNYYSVTGSTRTGIIQDRISKNTKLIGDINYEYPTNTQLNLQDYFYDFISTGYCDGGTVTDAGGLTVDITAGEGFCRRGTPYFDTFSVEWDGYTAMPLQANATNYIHYSTLTSSLQSSTTPVGDSEILLATVITNGSSIRFLHNTKNNITQINTNLQNYLLTTRKTFQISGIATIQGTTNRKLDISSGSYYLGLEQISVAGSGGDATFSYFYGTNGATEVSGQTLLDITQYDNAGTLTTMTDGYYRVDTVYVTSDNRISVIYGTEQFSSSALAQSASLANSPSFIELTAYSTAKVVVLKNSGIDTIIDARPSTSTVGGSGSGVSVHSALAGLSADDHTQYLLATGARSMSGSLNMGGFDITNVGNVDGVDVSTHASRHNPGGLDALATGTPVAISVGASPAAGSASSYSLSDHQHGITTAAPSTIGTSNSAGTASSVSRSDHVHNHGNQTDGNHHATAIAGVSNGFLSSTDKSKLDGIEAGATNTALASATPSAVDATTGSVGVGTTAARSDHTHTVNTAAPSALTVGGSNVTGTNVTLSRSDHAHSLPAFGSTSGTFAEGNDSRLTNDRTASGLRTATTVVSISGATAPTSGQALVASSSILATWVSVVPQTRTISTTNGISGGGDLSANLTISPTYGTTANTICQGNDSRLSDDRAASGLRSATTIVSISAATAPTSGQVLTASSGSLATWVTPLQLTSSAPANVTKAAASVGVAADAARSDHKHDITTASASALSVGGSSAEGTATSLARSDHTHALPAFGTTAGTFCQGNDSRLSDDRTASGLKTATTVVSISGATAPSAGQVLTANSSTNATWQNVTASTITNDEVTGTSTITTTSATAVLMTGMTVTPAAGDYLVWFTGDHIDSTNGATITTSIYVNGALVTSSERLFTNSTNTQRTSFCCVAKVTVTGVEAIEGRWRRTAGTATNTRRSLAYIKVG